MPKIGLDDFKAAGKTAADFWKTVVDELPIAEPEWEAPVSLEDPPLPSFPIDCFEAGMRDFAKAEAEATQTPIDLSAIVMLGSLSTAAQLSYVVEVDPGYTEPTNLYLAVFLPPANRKSRVFGDVVRPVIDYERGVVAEARAARDKWLAKRKIDELELKRLENKAASDKGTDGDRTAAIQKAIDLAADTEPRIPRLLFDDVTPEKLATVLADNGGFAGIQSAEGGSIVGNFGGRYSNMPNFEVLLKGKDDDELRVDRQNRDPQYIPRARISLVISPQPIVATQMGNIAGFRERGGSARFLPSFPKSMVGYRKIQTDPVNDVIREEWRLVVTDLLKLQPPRMSDADGNLVPAKLTLSQEARTALLSFQQEIEEQMRPGGKLAGMTDWAGKCPGSAVRIAGLLHLARHACIKVPEQTPIENDVMLNAITIMRYFIPHAEVFYDRLSQSGDLSLARAVWAALEKQPAETTKQRVYQALRGATAFRTADTLDDPLQLLEDAGYIRTYKVVPVNKHGERGGRPQVKIVVNPLTRLPKTPKTPTTPVSGVDLAEIESERDAEIDDFNYGRPAA